MRAYPLVAVLLLVAASIAIPQAIACHDDEYRGFGFWHTVDPVYEEENRWNEGSCSVSDHPVSCEVTPIVQAGSPTNFNGYRRGVYLYDCDTYASSRTYWSVNGSQDLGEPRCQEIPYVAVLGVPVPGTGGSHCIPPQQYVNATHSEEVRTQEGIIRERGVFLIYDGPSQPAYTVLSPTHLASACSNPRPGSNDVPYGALTIGTFEIRYLNCPE